MKLGLIICAVIFSEVINASQHSCGSVQNNILRSPGYPSNYSSNIHCVYRVRIPLNKGLLISFNYFSLESHSSCGYDYLRITDANSNTIGTYCGDQTGKSVRVLGTAAVLTFHTDGSVQNRGFQLFFSFFRQSPVCRSVQNNILRSPRYPSNYPNNVDCVNQVFIPLNKGLLVSFNYFSLESHSRCAYDYLRIIDGSGNPIGTYCGNQTGKSARIVSNVAVLIFHTDGSAQGRGFELSFSFFRQSPTCRSVQNNILRSPGYPSNYPNNVDCVNQVFIPLNKGLLVSFNYFSLESHSRCEYDYLRIIDGSGNPIGTYCGNQTGKSARIVSNVAVLIFHTDGSAQGRGFELSFSFFRQSPTCRSVQNNILRSPGYPSNYPNNVDCVNQVFIPLNKGLLVSFNYFSLESHSRCEYDYLRIIDGSGNPIGTYCGNQTGKSARIVSNVAVLIFHTDGSAQGRGFELSFSFFRQSPTCRSVQNNILRSPGYPSNYPNNVDCVNQVFIPLNKGLLVSFNYFSLESHSRCEYDYLRIIDGSGNPIGTYCGNQTGKSARIVSNVAVLIFHTDGSAQGRGFELSFSFFRQSPTCRSVQNNILRSPGYPSNYPNNVDCVNQVFIPLNKGLLVSFNYFSLESHSRCEYDYLRIIDGSGNPIGTYCGNQTGKSARIVSNVAVLIFHTDGSAQGRGFELSFSFFRQSPTCRSVQNNILRSPGYPSNYPNNVDCVNQVFIPLNKGLLVSFNYFSLESHSRCEYDYLRIIDGSGNPIGTYCGNQTGKSARIVSNVAVLIFHTDGSAQGRGFELSFSFFRQSPTCRSVQNNILRSPRYPSNYPNNVDCVYQVFIPLNKSLLVSFNYFSLESGSRCTYDYLRITDDSGNTIGTYCGNQTGKSVRVFGTAAVLTFHTDGSVQRRGYELYFSFFSKSVGCGSVQNNMLRSPGYPSNYPSNIHCVYRVRIPLNKGLLISLNYFSLESHSRCGSDYLRIADGSNNTIGTYCGNQTGKSVRVVGSVALLTFHTDGSVQSRGFQLSFSFFRQSPVCRSVQTNILRSPRYPSNYPNNVDCVNQVFIPLNKGLLVSFNYFSLESHSRCAYDYLRIIDGSGNPIGTYCGNQTGKSARIVSNVAVLIFHTDGSAQGRGFELSFSFFRQSPTCRSVQNNILRSPGYPSNYPNNVDCVYQVFIPLNKSLLVSFNYFSLESGSRCTYDYLRITDDSGNTIGTYCGNQTGKSVRVFGTAAVLTFHTDGSVQRRGYELYFSFFSKSVGCGSVQNNMLRSPGYPSNYPSNIHCVYRVRIPLNKGLLISLNYFSLESHSRCGSDYLRIADGSNNTIGTYCGNQTGKSVRVVGSVALLTFHTDGSVQSRGFQLSFSFFRQSPACRSVQNNILRSPRYPSNYPNNVDCVYQVFIPLNKSLLVSFNYFSLESGSRCTYDYLRITDDSGNTIGTYCGNQTGKSVRVFGTAAVLTFHTDGSVQRRGYELHFSFFSKSVGCGSVQNNILRSPGYPSYYPSNIHCVYRVHIPLNKGLLISFNHFSLESHSRCGYDYLRITDGSNNTIGTYCGNQTGKSVRVVGSVALLTFHTDGSVQSRGFQLSFSFFRQSPACRSVQNHILRSPGYPRNYPNNVDCVYQMFIPLNKGLLVFFNYFSLESHSRCAYDYLRITDGSGNPVGTYCGYQTGKSVRIAGTVAVLIFHTDASDQRRGFELSFTFFRPSPNSSTLVAISTATPAIPPVITFAIASSTTLGITSATISMTTFTTATSAAATYASMTLVTATSTSTTMSSVTVTPLKSSNRISTLNTSSTTFACASTVTFTSTSTNFPTTSLITFITPSVVTPITTPTTTPAITPTTTSVSPPTSSFTNTPSTSSNTVPATFSFINSATISSITSSKSSANTSGSTPVITSITTSATLPITTSAITSTTTSTTTPITPPVIKSIISSTTSATTPAITSTSKPTSTSTTTPTIFSITASITLSITRSNFTTSSKTKSITTAAITSSTASVTSPIASDAITFTTTSSTALTTPLSITSNTSITTSTTIPAITSTTTYASTYTTTPVITSSTASITLLITPPAITSTVSLTTSTITPSITSTTTSVTLSIITPAITSTTTSTTTFTTILVITTTTASVTSPITTPAIFPTTTSTTTSTTFPALTFTTSMITFTTTPATTFTTTSNPSSITTPPITFFTASVPSPITTPVIFSTTTSTSTSTTTPTTTAITTLVITTTTTSVTSTITNLAISSTTISITTPITAVAITSTKSITTSTTTSATTSSTSAITPAINTITLSVTSLTSTSVITVSATSIVTSVVLPAITSTPTSVTPPTTNPVITSATKFVTFSIATPAITSTTTSTSTPTATPLITSTTTSTVMTFITPAVTSTKISASFFSTTSDITFTPSTTSTTAITPTATFLISPGTTPAIISTLESVTISATTSVIAFTTTSTPIYSITTATTSTATLSTPPDLTPTTTFLTTSSTTRPTTLGPNSSSVTPFTPHTYSPYSTVPLQIAMKESIVLWVTGLDVRKWHQEVEENFKAEVARLATKYCNINQAECVSNTTSSHPWRPSDMVFSRNMVHILPGYPKQSPDDPKVTMVAFYLSLPPEVSQGTVVPKDSLTIIVESNIANIGRSMDSFIVSVKPLSLPAKEFQTNNYKSNELGANHTAAIVGGVVGGCLFLVVIVVLLRAYGRRKRPGCYSCHLHNLPKDSIEAIGKEVDFTFEMKKGVCASFSNATDAELSQSKNLDLSGFDDHPKSFENPFYGKPIEDESLHLEKEEEL
ncbi:cubilin-like isoform X2 [Acropora palmata]|uniref:cubilin-like isoform X2 n=1 Tax=Acropora palmata TaxID=6131 RepID=UPI003D9FC9C6